MSCATCQGTGVVPLSSITGDPKSRGLAPCPDCTHFTNLGGGGSPPLFKTKRHRRPWTPTELEILRSFYPQGSNAVINALHEAGLPVRTPSSIKQAAKKVGIKSLENSGRFQKGTPPKNKGIRMSDHIRMKVQHTFFQEGKPNHNLLGYNLAVSYRPNLNRKNQDYWYIKIAKSKWVHLHVWCYLQHNQQPPMGYVIRMKDKSLFESTVRSLGFSEKPPKEEPIGHWQVLKLLAEKVQPLLECITCYENRLRNSGSLLLTDNYVATMITIREPEIRETLIREHPKLIAANRQRYINQREIKKRQQQ